MARKNVSVSEECSKEIAAYAKAKGVEQGEALDQLVMTGAKRLKALSKYNRTHTTAKAPKSKRATAKKAPAAKKTAKKAAAPKKGASAKKAAPKKSATKKSAAPKSGKVLNGSSSKGAGLPALGQAPAAPAAAAAAN